MKKVLVVEEDVSLFKAYQEMFKDKGISVVKASTGQEGYDLCCSEKPDLILLDIMLPGGMNGFDVIERLKKNPSTKNIPVIVTTNLDSEEKVAKSLGVQDYIIKAKTTKDEIVRLVMKHLE